MNMSTAAVLPLVISCYNVFIVSITWNTVYVRANEFIHLWLCKNLMCAKLVIC